MEDPSCSVTRLKDAEFKVKGNVIIGENFGRKSTWQNALTSLITAIFS